LLAIEKFLDTCPHISADTKYWFVRTESGIYFEGFVENGVFGLHYPNVTLKDLQFETTDLKKVEAFYEKVKARHPDSKRPGLIASQLVRLMAMKAGDFVIIPSHNSYTLAIGMITSEKVEETQIKFRRRDGGIGKTTIKTRQVQWIKQVPRWQISPKLDRSISAHIAITDISEQSEWIDTLLWDFYKKGDEYNFVLRVNTPDRIRAVELYGTLNNVLQILSIAEDEVGIEMDLEGTTTSINLNSPGFVRLTAGTVGIGVLGIIMNAMVGGNLEIDGVKKTMIFKTNSTVGREVATVLDAVSDFLDREAVRKKFSDLQVSQPETIKQMVEGKTLLPKIPTAEKK